MTGTRPPTCFEHGVEHRVALGIGQHELLGEIGEDAQPVRAGVDHEVDGALLAVEIEPALAVEHRRHDGKDALVGPPSAGSCHDHSPFFVFNLPRRGGAGR